MSNELTTRATLPSRDQWDVMREQADVLVQSGFLPKSITTAEQAMAIVMKGRELGIGPMYALSNIAVIEGKPTAGAELMLALIYRDHGDDAMTFPDTDEHGCTALYKRRNWREPQTFRFTMEDAKKAGLAGKQPWQKYPAAMCRARCISAVARMAFPDSIGGLYTPEEMGADVSVDAEGSVEIVEAPQNRYTPEETAQTVEANAAAVHAERIKNAGKMPAEEGASANQLATIAKLSRLLGEPEEAAGGMTSDEATERITELSRQYSERKNAAKPAPAEDEDTRAARFREAASLAQWQSDKTGEPPRDILKRIAAELEIPGREQYTVQDLDRILEVLKQAPVPAEEATT